MNFHGCTVFTAADAAQVIGVAVRPTPIGTVGCAYEAEKATSSSGWHRNVAVNISMYKSASDEASAWDQQKTLRSLRPDRKISPFSVASAQKPTCKFRPTTALSTVRFGFIRTFPISG